MKDAARSRKPPPIALAVAAAVALAAVSAIYALRDSPEIPQPQASPSVRTELPPDSPVSVSVPVQEPASAEDSVPEAAPASSPSLGLSAAEFERLLDRTYRELPTLEEIQRLPEEDAHDYPEPVARAGAALGDIAQAVEVEPSLKPQATGFYVQCARDGALVTPVRALCYSHVIGDPKAPSEETLPSEVVRLAKLALSGD